MGENLFDENGPLHPRRIGQDKYEMHIAIPPDESGMVGRECTNEDCSPGYFKVKPGTGITEGQTIAYCPYCRTCAEPEDFLTDAQKNYALNLLKNEAIKSMNKAIQKGLGVGPSGRKRYGGGMFSLEVSYKPSSPRIVSRPFEEELQRNILCPHCGLEHAVFGLAVWCPDCGEDIFLTHIAEELAVIDKILSAVDQRHTELGARVVARDIENSLEDLVSIYETVLKLVTRRHLSRLGIAPEEISNIMENKIRNQYQNIDNSANTFKQFVGLDIFENIDEKDVDYLRITFEKRHPITHNLGIIDRKYLQRIRSGELEGREVRVSVDELQRAISVVNKVLASVYNRWNVTEKKP